MFLSYPNKNIKALQNAINNDKVIMKTIKELKAIK